MNDGDSRRLQFLPRHHVRLDTGYGEGDHGLEAAAGEAVAQFAALAHQALERVVGKAEGGLSGKRRIPEVDGRGGVAGGRGCGGERGAESRAGAREELAAVPW